VTAAAVMRPSHRVARVMAAPVVALTSLSHEIRDITVLKETKEENKVEAAAAVVDSKSGTGLYTRGRRGRRGRGGHGDRGSRRGHGGRGGCAGRDGHGGKVIKNQSCTYCSKDNHTTEDCWKRQKDQSQQQQTQSRKCTRDASSDKNDVICYHCDESGHMRNECELKKRVDQIRRNRNGNGKGKGKGLLAIEDKPSSSNQVGDMYENAE